MHKVWYFFYHTKVNILTLPIWSHLVFKNGNGERHWIRLFINICMCSCDIGSRKTTICYLDIFIPVLYVMVIKHYLVDCNLLIWGKGRAWKILGGQILFQQHFFGSGEPPNRYVHKPRNMGGLFWFTYRLRHQAVTSAIHAAVSSPPPEQKLQRVARERESVFKHTDTISK